MNKKEYILILFSSLLLFGSCIEEDLDDCLRGKYICFKTNNPKYKYEEVVDKVNLYLYDEGENLVSEYSYSRQQLIDSDYKAYLPQHLNGNYLLVALVNHEDCYSTTEVSQLSKLKTKLNAENDSVRSKQADLYHAYREVSFGDTYHITSDTVSLSKNTNHINLEVELRDYPMPANATLCTHICGCNGIYNYNNKSLGGAKLTYIPHTLVSENISGNKITLNNISTIMRLWIGDDLSICLEQHEPGKSPVNLTNLMLTKEIASIANDLTNEKLYDTNEKLELEDEFRIRVVLDGELSVVELRINNWYLIKEDVDL